MHHHGAEVRQVLQLLPRLLDGDALVRPQPGVLRRKLLHELRVVRVEHLDAEEAEPEVGCPQLDRLGIAKEDQVRDATAQQDVRRLKDAVVGGLGHHDRAAVVACDVLKLVLEHQRRHDLRAVHLQGAQQGRDVDVLGEQAARHLHLAPARGHRTLEAEHLVRCGECAQLGHADRQLVVDAVDQPRDGVGDLVAAQQDDAGQLREGAGRVRQQQPGQHVGTVAGHDDRRLRREPPQHVRQRHGRDQDVLALAIEQFGVAQHQVGVDSLELGAQCGRGQQPVRRQGSGDDAGKLGQFGADGLELLRRHFLAGGPVE